jgi:signal transduction histidine kinase
MRGAAMSLFHSLQDVYYDAMHLAISKWLVEAHVGQISARSEVGRGTITTFTLPITHEGASHGETARSD